MSTEENFDILGPLAYFLVYHYKKSMYLYGLLPMAFFCILFFSSHFPQSLNTPLKMIIEYKLISDFSTDDP